MKKFDVLGIGAALVDTEIRIDDSTLSSLKLEKGLMTLCSAEEQLEKITALNEITQEAHHSSGGSAANTMIAASYMGCNNFYTCKVAQDEDGARFLQGLKDAKLNFNTNEQQLSGVTGKCLVLVTPDAERTMNTCLGISESLSTGNLHLDTVADSRFLYLEGYLATSDTGKAAAIKLRETAEQTDTAICMTLSDPGIVEYFKPGLEEMLGQQADILFCNLDEALKWTGASTTDEALERLKQSAKRFAVTLGSQGAMLFDGDTMVMVAAPQVEAIDTNGAGDAFAGGFLAALSKGKSYEEAGEFGCLVASQVVSQMGPRLQAEQYRELATKIQT